MKLQDFKSKFLQSWVQFVLMDEKGNLLETCSTLFSFPQTFGNLLDEIPFLDSINDVLSGLKTGEEISFPCINVDLPGFEGYCDYVFHKTDYRGKNNILWILMDFSQHYTNLIDLQQQRNESVIQRELLEIEKKNAILARELLQYKNDELKRIQELKTDFFSKISHEVRTPINGILGMAQLLQEQRDPEVIKEYAGTIYETSKHLSTVVNDVLELSKIESNKISFEKVGFDIRSVVNAVVATYVYLGRQKGIQVTAGIHQNVPDFLIGDKVRLSQILYNLLSNSLKFTRKGRINLEVRVHDSRGQTFNIEFELKDTGIGISAKNLERIFEPYEQASLNTGHSYGGTGLGLPIVKQLVQQQKGSIAATSEPGKGATFTFRLPFDRADHVGAAKRRRRHVVVNKKLDILVGEDNALNQKILTEFTKKWGFKIKVVENGHKVLKELDQREFDLLILDYKMPEMDGLETLEYIRSNFDRKVNAIPVILFTGEMNKKILAKFTRLNVKRILNKPVEPKLLLDTIGTIFDDKAISGNFNLDYAVEMTSGDRRLIHDMIDIFINTMPAELQKMKNFVNDGDFEGLAKAIHKMRPNFYYMGVHKAEGIFKLLEKDLEAGKTPGQVLTRINSLERIAANTIKNLKVEKLNWVN